MERKSASSFDALEDVVAHELVEIADRRRAREGATEAESEGEPRDMVEEIKANVRSRQPHRARSLFDEASVEDLNLSGLALSGGGIRSATFNLGVIQALEERGLLEHFDYLSTVSGGGYVGSTLSALGSSEEPPRAANEPRLLAQTPGEEEPPAVQHLRRHGNYLSPDGSLGTLRIPIYLFRGILLNLLTLVPVLIAAVAVTDVVYGETLQRAVASKSFPLADHYAVTPFLLPGFVLLAILALFPAHAFGFGWRGWDRLDRALTVVLLLCVLLAAAETLPLLLFHYSRLRGHGVEWDAGAIAQFGALLAPFLAAARAHESSSRVIRALVLALLAVLGPSLLLLLYLHLGSWLLLHEAGQSFDHLQLRPFVYGGIGGGSLVLTWLLYDANVTSLRRFYRDRLSRAYLVGSRNSHPDRRKLSELRPTSPISPYHLINATLNLHGDQEYQRTGMPADFFLFSKEFVGSDATGYRRTSEMEKLDRKLDLATAMAVSGAAVDPSAGHLKTGPIAFIMALLNLRLGYWIPHPGRAKSRLRLLGVGPFYFFYEMLRRAPLEHQYVHVSDGGHVENLGGLSLLRRKCRHIVLCDAEQDADMSFSGLAKLRRLAKSQGILLEIDVEEILEDEDGSSRSHVALGKIHYREKGTKPWEGDLLYIKSSLCSRTSHCGGAEVDIDSYATKNRAFPHHSTGDQFFDSEQFEAYRALGYHVVKDLLDNAERGQKCSSIAELFDRTQEAMSQRQEG